MFGIDIIIIGYIVYYVDKKYGEETKKTDRLSRHLQASSAGRQDGNSQRGNSVGLLAAIVSDKRDKQLGQITQIEKSEEDKMVDRNLAITMGMLGASIAGLLFAPFNLLAVAGAVIAGKPIFKAAHKTVTQKKKVNIEVIDSILIVATFAGGYFVAGSIGAFFYYAAKKLLLKTEDHSKRKLTEAFGEQPRHVWLVRGEFEIEIPFDQLQQGEIISISAGNMVPVDGKVVWGRAIVDQHALTGEAQPVEKSAGDNCFASTLILAGRIHVKVEKSGDETAAAQIFKILKQSIDFKEELISKGQKLADKSALPLLLLSGASLPFVGYAGAASILYANFGYSLRMVSPVMMLNFLTIASEEGVLIKDGRSLEVLNKIDTVIFDKTGTLTLSKPHVAHIHALNGLDESQLLAYAAAAEYRQTHPIALAILEEAENRQLVLPVIDHAKYEIGYGIKVEMDNKEIRIGSARFMESEGVDIPNPIREKADEAQQNGNTFIYLAIGLHLHGAIELHPTIRPEAAKVIQELKAINMDCYIISGDHELPTRHLAQQLGIEHYFAGVFPEGKAKLVTALQQQNKTVCFVGDGINDSIALQKADLSVSLRGASTLATDTAQIILMKENLNQLPLLFDLGQQFDGHTKTNVLTSVVPSLVTIGGVFLFHFGLALAIASSQIGLLAGIGNSMNLTWRYQRAKNNAMRLDSKNKKGERGR